MDNLLSTNQKMSNLSTVQAPKLPSAHEVFIDELQSESHFAKTETTEPNLNLVGKANLFLQKEVIKNTGIKWLHVVIVAVAYVAYVELVADTRTKRKLKFW